MEVGSVMKFFLTWQHSWNFMFIWEIKIFQKMECRSSLPWWIQVHRHCDLWVCECLSYEQSLDVNLVNKETGICQFVNFSYGQHLSYPEDYPCWLQVKQKKTGSSRRKLSQGRWAHLFRRGNIYIYIYTLDFFKKKAETRQQQQPVGKGKS